VAIVTNSGKYDGLRYAAAVDAVAADLAAKGLGEKKVTFRLRDWGISRQRYWGTPIPMIHCADCGAVPVPERPAGGAAGRLRTGRQRQPAEQVRSLPEVRLPEVRQAGAPRNRHHGHLRRFVVVLHALYLAGLERRDGRCRNDYWMPMDQYIGGIEHAVLHLLYARFWTKVMRDFGLVKFDEPFTNLLTQGMVLNETYYREDAAGKKTWFNPADVDLTLDDKGRPQGAVLKADGQPVEIGGTEKMSKSKNNGIDPQAQIEQYGADTARLFTMFASPPEQTLEWSGSGVEGANRFLRRVWNFGYAQREAIAAAGAAAAAATTDAGKTLRREVHKVLQQADYDFKRIQYNTVVSACMKMLNTLESAKDVEAAC
jgi:leucyl-tRNA synthetase